MLETLKFPKDRASLIHNNKQRYATFNILNAGFNHCMQNSIEVIVDGDDQLIGKQVFQLINAEYQTNDLWVMYNFYKNDKYVEGVSIPFKN